MLFQCCASIVDAGTTLKQHYVSACRLGGGGVADNLLVRRHTGVKCSMVDENTGDKYSISRINKSVVRIIKTI